MRSRWNLEPAVWTPGDAESVPALILASGLLIFAIFAMPVLAGKFLAYRLGMPDILLFSAMPGIIAYRFFCAKKLPLNLLEREEVIQILLLALLILGAAVAATFLWKKLLTLLNVDFVQRQFAVELVARSRGADRIKLFFALCVATPLMEELLFRRIVYGTLLRFGMGTAFFGTALLFSFCHFFAAGLPGLFILGLGFQFAYLKFRNLSAAVLLHGLVNAAAFIGTLNTVE
ncbi:MAG: CPBP family intramembrane metalloprotease [Lentisphaerae bacterium]|nr:CPBP family intramembrane metalloprotease [Lentisphaerota bacterium]